MVVQAVCRNLAALPPPNKHPYTCSYIHAHTHVVMCLWRTWDRSMPNTQSQIGPYLEDLECELVYVHRIGLERIHPRRTLLVIHTTGYRCEYTCPHTCPFNCPRTVFKFISTPMSIRMLTPVFAHMSNASHRCPFPCHMHHTHSVETRPSSFSIDLACACLYRVLADISI